MKSMPVVAALRNKEVMMKSQQITTNHYTMKRERPLKKSFSDLIAELDQMLMMD
jgi:hypothetical protein